MSLVQPVVQAPIPRPSGLNLGAALLRFSVAGRGVVVLVGRASGLAAVDVLDAPGFQVPQGRGVAPLGLTVRARGAALLRGQAAATVRLGAVGRGRQIPPRGRARVRLIASGRGTGITQGWGRAGLAIRSSHLLNRVRFSRTAGVVRLVMLDRTAVLTVPLAAEAAVTLAPVAISTVTKGLVEPVAAAPTEDL